MTEHPRRSWWQKLLRQITPLVIAGLALSAATGGAHTIAQHVEVSIRIH